jgi:hypothetical protein
VIKQKENYRGGAFNEINRQFGREIWREERDCPEDLRIDRTIILN